MDTVLAAFVAKLPDYGALVMLQFVVICALAWALRYQTKRLEGVQDKTLDVIVANTGAISKLATQAEAAHGKS